MIEIFRKTPTFDFMRHRFTWMVVSVVAVLGSLFIAYEQGENALGIDFIGGAQVEFHFDQPVDIERVRQAFRDAKATSVSVQRFTAGPEENAFSVRFRAESSKEAEELTASALRAISGVSATIDQSTFIGPVIGRQILVSGIEAFALALLAMLVYVGIRFDFSFAVGTVIALFHDVIVALGAYVLTGREISSVLLAAALTIIGYSVNDSIIVLDRIRENLTRLSKTGTARKAVSEQFTSMSAVVNLSINQTLGRTILTSFTTFVTAVSLWWFGTGVISDLGFATAVGVVVGTYSTIFVATPIVMLWWRPRKSSA